MKKILNINLTWLAIIVIIALFLILSSCSVSKPHKSPQNWTVVSVGNTDFKATNGKITASFAKIGCDSVFVGKIVTVTVGKSIK